MIQLAMTTSCDGKRQDLSCGKSTGSLFVLCMVQKVRGRAPPFEEF